MVILKALAYLQGALRKKMIKRIVGQYLPQLKNVQIESVNRKALKSSYANNLSKLFERHLHLLSGGTTWKHRSLFHWSSKPTVLMSILFIFLVFTFYFWALPLFNVAAFATASAFLLASSPAAKKARWKIIQQVFSKVCLWLGYQVSFGLWALEDKILPSKKFCGMPEFSGK